MNFRDAEIVEINFFFLLSVHSLNRFYLPLKLSNVANFFLVS